MKIKEQLSIELQHSRANLSTAESIMTNYRGTIENIEIRMVDDLKIQKFNDQTDFDMDLDPGIIWEDLN